MVKDLDPHPDVLSRVTLRRASLLWAVESGFSQPEIAQQMGISPATVHSEIEFLRDLTGCGSMPELGRWWREKKLSWVNHLAATAGIQERRER